MICVDVFIVCVDDCMFLDNFNFNVGKGEVFVFLGGNGVGKFIIFKIFLGFMKVSSGSVIVLGYNVFI